MFRPITIAVVALSLAACSGPSSTTYSRQDLGRVMESTDGVVVSSRMVDVEGESSGLGSVTGGITGGAVGSTIGSGSGSVLAGAALAIVGIIAGALVETALTSETGVEYTVQTNDGRVLTVIQVAESDDPIPDGSPVRVQFGGQYTRVIPVVHGESDRMIPPREGPGAAPLSEPEAIMTPSRPGGFGTPSTPGDPTLGDDDVWIDPDTGEPDGRFGGSDAPRRGVTGDTSPGTRTETSSDTSEDGWSGTDSSTGAPGFDPPF